MIDNFGMLTVADGEFISRVLAARVADHQFLSQMVLILPTTFCMGLSVTVAGAKLMYSTAILQ